MIVTFGESRSTRREWEVFDGRSPPVSTNVNGAVSEGGTEEESLDVLVARRVAGGEGNGGWLPMRI